MASFNTWLFVAFLAALATCLTHVLLGGLLFARPLLDSELRSPLKHTHYFCWHLVTAALAIIAGALLWAALAPQARAAAFVATALAGAFLVVNVAQNLLQRLSFARHPQGAFFAVIVACALAGLAYG